MDHYCTLVLHAHLPFVLHKEPDHLEERWLFEAISESYIPLIWSLEKSPQARLTLSLSPPLLEMLSDERLTSRFTEYLNMTLALIKKESDYVTSEKEKEIVRFYEKRFQRIKRTFLEWNGNLLSAFKSYVLQNKLECITSSATHAFLPYIETEQALRLQIKNGLDCFEHHFGYRPDGIWLPECAFTPGVDKVLFEEGVRYTFVDETTIETLDPAPADLSVPVYSPHGIVLFPRHTAVSRKVWDAKTGYPGDWNYREFYRDIGYVREFDYIKDFIHPEGIRVDTGLKYNRITGDTEDKQWYERENALEKVAEHCEDFIGSIQGTFQIGDQKDTPPITIASFDAELFGHWWFEGPDWISLLLSNEEAQLPWMTPKDYVQYHYEKLETHHVCFSTWGRNSYGEVWLNERNAWMYRHLHEMERQLLNCFARNNTDSPLKRSALQQMAKEWMLAASSDWAFILDQQSTTEYAIQRFKDHAAAFDQLKRGLENETITHEQLEEIESRYSFLQWCEIPDPSSLHDQYIRSTLLNSSRENNRRHVLMLAWEFPPNIVGGLARHVYDLTRALVKQGYGVHVITNAVDGAPDYEVMEGVHVYRVQGDQPYEEDFFNWTGSLNIAIVRKAMSLSERITFDCIHAHDWIVSVSAKSLKQQLNIPLYVTIHATEHGRNDGIHTDLQGSIHHKEWELMFEAEHIMVCSSYMRQELIGVFQIPEEKVSVIPNGVDPNLLSTSSNSRHWRNRFGNENDFYVFSLGRIVPEKGFKVLIDSASLMKESHPSIKFIIAGKGPMLDEYRSIVRNRNLDDNVFFIGYVSDEERNAFMKDADAIVFPSLYEPFGIVALEAMAAKTPVIVSDTGGLGDIIEHGRNGLKVYKGNPESICDQILSIYQNPHIGQSMVEQAWNDVLDKYSWDQIAKKTMTVFIKDREKMAREEFV